MNPSHRTPLDALPLRVPARIAEVVAEDEMLIRLLEMGFVRGTEVRIIKRAPLGDPLEIEVRGYHVSLRAREARSVVVERTG